MMADTQKPTALTYEEAAVRLGVSRQAVSDFVKAGKLRRGRRASDGRLMVNAADVEQLVKERQRKQEDGVIWEE
jgi:excisionase family DNA binding protein